MSDAVRTVPLRGVRGMIADAMVKSLATAAQLTYHTSADATALLDLKAKLAEAGTKASVEDLLMLAVVLALKKHPDADGKVEGLEMHLHSAIDLPGPSRCPAICWLRLRFLVHMAWTSQRCALCDRIWRRLPRSIT